MYCEDAMNTSLVFNFIKRVFIIPVAITLVAVALVCTFVPKFVDYSDKLIVETSADVDISNYKLTDFNRFKDIDNGTYIGTLTVPDVKINCAVVYNSDSQPNALNMIKGSAEPWNSGGMVIKGTNQKSQLNRLHNANVGDFVEFDPYKNDTCKYVIKQIKYGVEETNLTKYIKKNSLVLCLPYTNFYNGNEQNFYTVYIAELYNGGDVVE